MDVLRLIGNVLWLIIAGIWLALGYAFWGVLLCITIIGIPFGVQAFKMAGFVLWPFGRTVIRSTQGGCLEVGFNILWLIFAGWSLFLAHLFAGLILCITIVGIPFGIQAFKLSVLSLWPFGRSVMSAHEVGERHVVYAVPVDPTRR